MAKYHAQDHRQPNIFIFIYKGSAVLCAAFCLRFTQSEKSVFPQHSEASSASLTLVHARKCVVEVRQPYQVSDVSSSGTYIGDCSIDKTMLARATFNTSEEAFSVVHWDMNQVRLFGELEDQATLSNS